MSLKFDKDFLRGLFTHEESNKHLFIIPVLCFLFMIVLFLGVNVIPAKQGSEAPIQSLLFVFGGMASLLVTTATSIYLYKHVLRYNPFKDSENEDNRVASVFMLSLFCGVITMYSSILVFGTLTNPTVKSNLLSFNTLSLAVGSLIVFAVIQSFFKYFVLNQVYLIMAKKDQVQELKETEI